MRVLVTGATGFFGPEIVAVLQESGHDVMAASRQAGAAAGTLAMDITSPDSCTRAFGAAGSVDVVVHAAAFAHVKRNRKTQALCRLVNIQGTANVVDAAVSCGVSHFVFISSIMVYGDYDLPLRAEETAACRPQSIYGEAKLEGERICQGRADFETVHVLRMATMYSPDWLFNVRKRVRPVARGRPVYFNLDPMTRRYSLCSRRNGAEAVLWSVEQRLAPGVYNVADCYEYSQEDIRRAVEQADGIGWQVTVPVMIPRALLHMVRCGVPFQRWRENARSRYWKYCEHNLYSSDKLRRAGVEAPPDLLALGRTG
jgi:nucleoside-diphosphate-sugar epimerase